MEINKYSIFSRAALVMVFLAALGYTAKAQVPPLVDCNGIGDPPTFSATCGNATNWAYITSVSTTGGSTNITNNNTNCGNGTTSYSDYTGTSMKVTQMAGQSVDVKVGWSGNSSVNIKSTVTKIYVDWNRDGKFDGPDEYVDPGPFTGVHPYIHGTGGITISVPVPPHAKEGLTRMRIITSARQNIAVASALTPCNADFGEAEDYTFEVINPCVPPNVLSIANVDFKSGDFSWTEKLNAEFYEYVITPVDTIPHDTVIGFTFTTNNSIEVDTFACDTKYYILVRCICDTTNKIGAIYWDKSEWIRDSFTTDPCCYEPDLKLDMVTHNSARLRWDPIATSIGYEYAVSTLNTPPQQGTFTINTSVVVQGLSPKTTYFVHVRSRCVPTPLSDWSQVAFKTAGGLSVANTDPGRLEMSVFPNPAQDIINVEFSNNRSGNAMVRLTDLTGKVIYSMPVTSDKLEFNAAELASGMYIIQYSDDEHSEVMRVTKQ